MKKRKVFMLSVLSVVLVLSLIVPACAPALVDTVVDILDTSAATIYVPDNYTTIQAAVDAANPGDVIVVRDGIYTENVDVNKDHLTIQSETGADVTVVQAAIVQDHVFELRANWVNIEGLTVRGATYDITAGVYLENTEHCRITNNSISNNKGNGIVLYNSIYSEISNNYLENDGIAIWGWEHKLSHFNTHTIEGNTINGRPIYYYKDKSGIKVPEDAGEVILANCTDVIVESVNAPAGTVGIELAYTRDCRISNNTVGNAWHGIWLWHSSSNDIENNTLTTSLYGIYLYDSHNNNIRYNNIIDRNNWGVQLWKSDNNTITDNAMNSNLYGVSLSESSGNNIVNNSINSNKYDGLWADNSHDNYVYLNDFTNNGRNVANYQSINIWNSPEERAYTYNGDTYTNYLGNYWSDYAGSDADGDGIGDTPYPIDSDADSYPLMEPFENYGIAESPWPMFQHDPQHTGRTPLVVPPSSELKAEVLAEGQDVSDYFQTPVVGSDGVLYTVACIGGSVGLYAFYPNGTQKWCNQEIGGSVFWKTSALSEVTGTLYVMNSDGISAVNIVNGEQRWKRGFAIIFGDQSPVLVDDEILYFVAGLTLPDGSSDVCLISLDLNGNTNWIRALERGQLFYFNLPEERAEMYSSNSQASVPTIGTDGTIYLGYRDTLLALDTQGALQWQRQFPKYGGGAGEARVGTVSIADDGIIYVPVNGDRDSQGWNVHLHAIDTQSPMGDRWCKVFSGELMPERSVPGISFNSNVYVTERRYADPGGGQSYLHVFDSAGSLVWSRAFTGRGFPSFLLIDANDTVYVLRKSTYGTACLHIFDASGNETQVTLPDQEGHRSDALSLGPDGTLYVGGHKKLYAIGEAAASPEQPARPQNLSPEDASIDVSTMPILTSSEFQHPDLEAEHVASHWRIRTEEGDYDGPVLSRVSTSSLTLFAIPSHLLEHDTIYYWQVRHKDNDGLWSDWSEETSFTTLQEPYAKFEVIDRRSGYVLLDASPSVSRHPDGSIVLYAWNISEDEYNLQVAQETARLNAWWLAEGTYDITLSVMDDKGGISAYQETVDVTSSWFDRLVLILAKWLGYTDGNTVATLSLSSLIPQQLKWLFFPSWENLAEVDEWLRYDYRLRYSVGTRLDWTDKDPEDIVYVLNKEIEEGFRYRDFIAMMMEQERMACQAHEELGDTGYHQGFPALTKLIELLGKEVASSVLKSGLMKLLELPWQIETAVKVIGVPTQLSGWEEIMTAIEQAAYARAFGSYILYRESGNDPTMRRSYEGVVEAMLWGNPDDIVGTMMQDIETQFSDLYNFYDGLGWDFNIIRTEVKNLINGLLEQYKNELPSKQKWYQRLVSWNLGELRSCDSNSGVTGLIDGDLGELRFYDSNGNVTGIVNGEIKEEIENSIFLPEEGAIAFYGPMAAVGAEFVGTHEGSYDLSSYWRQGGVEVTFAASEIPTTPGAVHHYTIDWNALSQGQEGVTVYVDSNGDGKIDYTVTGGNKLTGDDFIPPSSGCFIATAAYGTPMAGEIQVMREFRDEYLLTNPVGQALVDVYYRVSPPIAQFITDHPSLKPIVRAGLVPAVVVSTMVVSTTETEKIAILGLLLLVSAAVAVWATRRRDRRPECS